MQLFVHLFFICLCVYKNGVLSSRVNEGHLEEAREWLGMYNEEMTALYRSIQLDRWDSDMGRDNNNTESVSISFNLTCHIKYWLIKINLYDI